MSQDEEMPGDADGTGGGRVAFLQPGLEHCQRLIEAARNRLAHFTVNAHVPKTALGRGLV